MSDFLIFILIFVPLSFFILISFFIFWYISNEKKNERKSKKLTRFLIYDINRNKYYYEKNFDKQKHVFRKSRARKWNKFSDITDNFAPKIKKQFAEVLNNLEKGSMKEELKFSVKKYHLNKFTTFFEFYFNKLDQETDYLITMKFNVVKDPKQRKQKFIKETNRNSLIEIKNLYKGFMVFNLLNKSKKEEERKIVESLSKIYYSSQARYFFTNGMIIIVILGRKYSKVNKKIEKIKNRILSKGFKTGINNMYYGSATVISKKVDSLRNLNQIIQTLIYLISISILKKKNFANEKEDLEKTKLNTFIAASKIFVNAVKTGTIYTSKTIVRNWKTNKKIVEYAFPTISNINRNLLNSIIVNENNKRIIVDKHAEQLSFTKKINEPLLLDVYDYWIFENIDRIVNKKIMYVIHLNKYKSGSRLIELINKIKKLNISFAIHINNLNDSTATLIQSTKPGYVIIDRAVWNDDNLLSSENYMRMITLNSLSEKNNLKLIYQNPSKIINDKVSAKIGLKYYYEKI